MQNIFEETRFLMKKYNITANKSLGQNFLVDEKTVDKIVSSASVCSSDLIIEIGPGLGTLTSRLLENAGRVIAIELDERMLKVLKDRFSLYSNFEVINQDVLKVNLEEVINSNKGNFKSVKVVANLPYYITTPIIMKLLEDKLNIDSITVMVQKEVAQRLTATPGDKLSGAITYCVYYYSSPEVITIVPNTSFVPIPEVDSEVIKLNIRKSSIVNVENEKLFFKVIKASFMQRRKTLINGLVNGGIVKTKEDCKLIFNKLGLDFNIRGEALSICQFSEISNFLNKSL